MKGSQGLKDQEGDTLLVTFASPERPFHSSSKTVALCNLGHSDEVHQPTEVNSGTMYK